MSSFYNKYILSLLWIALILFSGVLFSGYHFVDDHEVYSFMEQLKFSSFSNVAESTLLNDLNARFRPFYYPYRILQVKLFGENFVLYYLHNLIVCLLSSLMLFKYALKLTKDNFKAFIFTIISLGGLGFAIFYRIGVNETMGVLFLALGLNTSLNPKKRFQAISFLSYLMASLCKESFVLLLPALAIWHVYSQNMPQNFKQLIVEAKQKAIFLITISILVSIELYIIKFKVGTNKIGYAGSPTALDATLMINLAKSFFRLFIQNGLFIIILIYLIYKNYNWKPQFIANIIIALMLATQFLVYAKSGMYERYLLPSSILLGLFYLLNTPINANKDFRIISYIIGIWSLGMAFYQTRNYAEVGEENQVLLKTILNKTKAESPIIIAGTPLTNGEWMLAMNRYFNNSNHQRMNISYLVIHENFSKETIGNSQLPAYTFKQASLDLTKQNFKILISPKENHQNLIKNHKGNQLKNIFESKQYLIYE